MATPTVDAFIINPPGAGVPPSREFKLKLNPFGDLNKITIIGANYTASTHFSVSAYPIQCGDFVVTQPPRKLNEDQYLLDGTFRAAGLGPGQVVTLNVLVFNEVGASSHPIQSTF